MTQDEQASIPLFVKLCSDKAAYEVRLRRKVVFSMDKLRQLLEASQIHKIVVYTPQMMIIRSGEAETTVSKDGRMLIKRVADQSQAVQVARSIIQLSAHYAHR